MNGAEARVLALAQRQYGVVSRQQALRAGMTARAVDRRLGARRWSVLYPGAYRIAGTPPAARGRALAATMWAGPDAFVSHLTAGALLRLEGVRTRDVHLWVPASSGLRSPSVTVHRGQPLAPVDRAVVDRIPCTAPARTLLDLGGMLDDESLEAAYEHARRTGLVTRSALARRFAELGRRGRPGTARVRRLLAAHTSRDRPLESRLEVKLWRLVVASALPRPVRQHWVACRGERYRLDLAWPAPRFAAEADGWEAHGGRLRWKRDLRRLSDLAASGWRVVHATWDDVTGAPAAVLDRIAEGLGRGV